MRMAGLLLAGLWFAALVGGQQIRPRATAAAGSKLVNVNDIIAESPLTVSGAAATTGVTGPTVTLGVASGAIGNSLLTNSSVTINAGSGLSGGGGVSLGGSTTLGVAAAGITNSMLFGSIDPSKITGTAAILGANSFIGNQNITGDLTISGGRIRLPDTSSSSVGVITLGVDSSNNPKPFLHNYGTNNCGCVVGNTFVGEFAGNFSTSATTVNGNTGVGYSALSSNSTGTSNTGIGYLALGRNTIGFSNTALGLQALFGNDTGYNNTALGFASLELNTDGHDNIAIGYGTGSSTGSDHNHDDLYIGNGVGAAENNTIRIGGTNQTKTFIAGISGVTTGGTGAAVVVDTNGQLGTVSSSRRFKYDIQDMQEATDKLLRLRPVTFRYKQAQSDGSHPLQFGLIAEEVAEVYPELVQNSPEGQPNTVLYHVLPAMLLNEFQKQHQEIEMQREQIRNLQEQMAQLMAQTQQLQREVTLKTLSNQDRKLVAVKTDSH